MTAPTSSAAPGRDVAAESALVERLAALRALDRRLTTATRLVAGAVMLVVLASACVLIALPDFLDFNCRSLQLEAQSRLRALFVAEQSFRAEYDRFSDSADQMGFDAGPTSAARFRYFVRLEEREGGPGFVAFAVGVGPGVVGDLWTVDERGAPSSLRDVCAR